MTTETPAKLRHDAKLMRENIRKNSLATALAIKTVDDVARDLEVQANSLEREKS